MTAEKETANRKIFNLIGVIQNRSKDTKGNPGLSGIHLFWIEFPAAILFSAGRRNGSGAVFLAAAADRKRGSRLDMHSWGLALCGLRLFQISWNDRRKNSRGHGLSRNSCIRKSWYSNPTAFTMRSCGTSSQKGKNLPANGRKILNPSHRLGRKNRRPEKWN